MFMPKTLSDFTGQPHAVRRLQVMIDSAKKMGQVNLPPMLFSGASGTGKTTLARAVAVEMDSTLKVVNGPAIRTKDDVLGVMGSLRDGHTLFIDEVHAMDIKAEETLYNILDNPDRKIGYFVIPDFTLIMATTMPGKLTEPMKNRLNAEINMKPYDNESMKDVLRFIVDQINIDLPEECYDILPQRTRFVPRNAVQLIKNIYDFAVQTNGINGQVHCSVEELIEACEIFGVDEYGFNDFDRDYLRCLAKRTYAGKCSVGLEHVTQSTGMDKKTVCQKVEPYMLRLDLVSHDTKGRTLTAEGIKLVNKMFADELHIDINE